MLSDPQSQLLGIKDLMDSGTFRSSQFHDLISQSYPPQEEHVLYPQSAEAQVGSFGRAVDDFQCQRLAPRHSQPQALKLQVKLTLPVMSLISLPWKLFHILMPQELQRQLPCSQSSAVDVRAVAMFRQPKMANMAPSIGHVSRPRLDLCPCSSRPQRNMMIL